MPELSPEEKAEVQSMINDPGMSPGDVKDMLDELSDAGYSLHFQDDDQGEPGGEIFEGVMLPEGMPERMTQVSKSEVAGAAAGEPAFVHYEPPAPAEDFAPSPADTTQPTVIEEPGSIQFVDDETGMMGEPITEPAFAAESNPLGLQATMARLEGKPAPSGTEIELPSAANATGREDVPYYRPPLQDHTEGALNYAFYYELPKKDGWTDEQWKVRADEEWAKVYDAAQKKGEMAIRHAFIDHPKAKTFNGKPIEMAGGLKAAGWAGTAASAMGEAANIRSAGLLGLGAQAVATPFLGAEEAMNAARNVGDAAYEVPFYGGEALSVAALLKPGGIAGNIFKGAEAAPGMMASMAARGASQIPGGKRLVGAAENMLTKALPEGGRALSAVGTLAKAPVSVGLGMAGFEGVHGTAENLQAQLGGEATVPISSELEQAARGGQMFAPTGPVFAGLAKGGGMLADWVLSGPIGRGITQAIRTGSELDWLGRLTKPQETIDMVRRAIRTPGVARELDAGEAAVSEFIEAQGASSLVKRELENANAVVAIGKEMMRYAKAAKDGFRSLVDVNTSFAGKAKEAEAAALMGRKQALGDAEAMLATRRGEAAEESMALTEWDVAAAETENMLRMQQSQLTKKAVEEADNIVARVTEIEGKQQDAVRSLTTSVQRDANTYEKRLLSEAEGYMSSGMAADDARTFTPTDPKPNWEPEIKMFFDQIDKVRLKGGFLPRSKARAMLKDVNEFMETQAVPKAEAVSERGVVKTMSWDEALETPGIKMPFPEGWSQMDDAAKAAFAKENNVVVVASTKTAAQHEEYRKIVSDFLEFEGGELNKYEQGFFQQLHAVMLAERGGAVQPHMGADEARLVERIIRSEQYGIDRPWFPATARGAEKAAPRLEERKVLREALGVQGIGKSYSPDNPKQTAAIRDRLVKIMQEGHEADTNAVKPDYQGFRDLMLTNNNLSNEYAATMTTAHWLEAVKGYGRQQGLLVGQGGAARGDEMGEALARAIEGGGRKAQRLGSLPAASRAGELGAQADTLAAGQEGLAQTRSLMKGEAKRQAQVAELISKRDAPQMAVVRADFDQALAEFRLEASELGVTGRAERATYPDFMRGIEAQLRKGDEAALRGIRAEFAKPREGMPNGMDTAALDELLVSNEALRNFFSSLGMTELKLAKLTRDQETKGAMQASQRLFKGGELADDLIEGAADEILTGLAGGSPLSNEALVLAQEAGAIRASRDRLGMEAVSNIEKITNEPEKQIRVYRGAIQKIHENLDPAGVKEIERIVAGNPTAQRSWNTLLNAWANEMIGSVGQQQLRTVVTEQGIRPWWMVPSKALRRVAYGSGKAAERGGAAPAGGRVITSTEQLVAAEDWGEFARGIEIIGQQLGQAMKRSDR